MQVAPTSGQNDNAISATWWLNLLSMQVAQSGGQICIVNKIIQVKDSIPWVRCASGNVLLLLAVTHKVILGDILVTLLSAIPVWKLSTF